MIVVDTSAWIEYLRRRESPADLRLTLAIEQGHDIAVTEVVVMEVLAGALSARHLRELRTLMLAFPIVELNGLAGFEEAAALYRACREAGETVRTLTDCLVAAAAIASGSSLLQADVDFEKLARHTPLRLEPLAV